MSAEPHEVDSVTGQRTTGHSWDGIRELNTPLPRWWLWTFYLSIIWSLGYFVAYPAWPLLSGYTRGVLGYSSRGAALDAVEAMKAQRAAQASGLASASLVAITQDAKMLEIALAQGKAAFGDNCTPCHGVGGGGNPNYPNLAGDRWIWGGTLDQIATTITHGARWDADPATHVSTMPAFGRDQMLKPAEIRAVANHVASLAKMPTEQGSNGALGAKVFADNCATCHGAQGKGNQSVGAPDLTGAIHLYASDVRSIAAQVENPRNGVMPAWGDRLDPVTIKSLAVYVHSLGGGQ